MSQLPVICVEIKTIPSTETDEELPVITIFVDEQHNYHIATGLQEIGQAILNTIPHLNTNFRYPSTFAIEFKSGSKNDAHFFSLQRRSSRRRTRKDS